MAVPKGIKQVEEAVWEIPASFKKGMNVPARIYATKKLLDAMDDGVFEQVTNVACLPGIVSYAIAMPDAHFGYGFPVGGVAAMDLKEGVISPGGLGFDLNCGMRVLTTNLKLNDVKPKIKELVNELYMLVPPGVGARASLKVTNSQLDEISVKGVKWCHENGYAWKEDLQKIEEHGAIAGGDGSKISEKAKERGRSQLGTLGSGNHYLEVQFVSAGQVYDESIASAFGIHDKDQICIMVHCGSRGFGHQIATDYLKLFDNAMQKHNIKISDRELSCAPYQSEEGQNYYKAMIGAANFAFANRQLITYHIREAFKRVFHKNPEDMEMQIVYDIAHNIGKIEKYKVNGKLRKLLIHRKGATRAFGPGNEELWGAYKKFGQPVIVGGSMETGSYLLVGTKKAEEETFGSTLHGSGRTMSRTQAKKMVRGDKLQKDMEARGIYVKAASMAGLAEESGISYKDINEVVEAVEKAGISKPVCSFKPLGNIKG
ncbi:RtcB family protein [Candidatus Woesearchaeota archaeon]|nr:RtcB family protein [Candidatus Woesearchaeota archaeon]